jgi:hypothetical protein
LFYQLKKFGYLIYTYLIGIFQKLLLNFNLQIENNICLSASEDDRIYPNYVRIFSDGTVKAMSISQLYAHCYFDFEDFPYDTQECGT